MNDDFYKMENGETDHILKASREYSIKRADQFKRECWQRWEILKNKKLKPKQLITACQKVFIDITEKIAPEIEAGQVLGELSMCERFYFEVLKMKEEEVTRDEIIGMLQIVTEHIQNHTVDKCGLASELKITVDKILERDGFYGNEPEKGNFEKLPKITPKTECTD